MEKYRVVDFIVDYLEYKNINTIFTVTGGGSIFINDAFSKKQSIKSIAHHNEQAASFAAEGYARMSNRLGVCVVTSGPGGTNTITGVLCSYQDSIPVLYISGNVRKELTTNFTKLNYRQLGDQEFNISDFVKPITKLSIQMNTNENLLVILEKFYSEATNGRPGPVWLDIPLDIQKSLVDKFNPLLLYPSIPNENEYDISNVIDLLSSAKKPLIIAGNGIRISNSISEFEELIKTLNIPVVHSFNGIDLLASSNKHNFGRIGIVGNIHANKIVQESDLIIAIGTRLYVRQIGYNLDSFGKNAKIIHVDIDQNELSKPTIKSDYKICMDAGKFIELVLKQNIITNYNFDDDRIRWIDRCITIKNDNPIILERHLISNPINPNGFLYQLSIKCPSNYNYVLSDGTANVTGSQVIQLKKNQRIFTNKATAPMGYGLPAAIGASYSHPNIVCIEGDGSLQMNLQELQTLVHYKQNIKLIILNNNGYLSIKTTQKNLCSGNLHLSNPESGLTLPNYQKIATAFGITYYSIDNLNNLDKILSQLFSNQDPAILEVFLDEDALHEPKIITKIDKEGNFTNPEFDDIEWLE
jgi:acetolactate synthase-1/2/3 large subunit